MRGNRDWLKMSEAADIAHVSYNTMRAYVKRGIIPFSKTPGGQHIIRRKDLNEFLGTAPEGNTVFYVRTSSSTGDTSGQETKLTQAYGKPSKIYRDKASSLNENRPGLKRLIRDAKKHEFTTICITAKERLTRFGWSYLTELLQDNNVTIKVLDDEREKDLHEELLQDFMSLLASFSGKYYKLRSLKHEKMLLDKVSRELQDNG